MKSVTSQKMPRIRIGKDEYELIQQYRRLKENATGKIEEKGDKLNITSYLAQSIEDIIREYEIDTNLWECIKFKPGNWTTPVKAKFRCEIEGEQKEIITTTMPVIIENRKSEAVFEKKIKIIDYDKFKRELIEDIKRFSPKSKINLNNKTLSSGNLLEINIPDLHLGKQSWAEETGFKNYDLKIACARFWSAFDDMLNRATKENKFEKILYIVGNDLFNSDNAYPYTQTTGGTPQQDDARWQKVFRTGRQLIIESILRLSQIAPVDVKIIPGNHDFQKSFYLGDVLEAYFDKNDFVFIDNSPRTRKYYQWGKCLLGFAHGNKRDEGENRLMNNFKNENSKAWGETLYREIHCGDIHHYKEVKQRGTSKDIDRYAEDIDGIVIKYLRTLMFNDEWEAKKGYISQKGAHCFVWDKEDGNVAEYKYNRYE
jgi:hypothetical protein